MKQTPKRREKLDAVDAEKVRQVMASYGWQLIRTRLHQTVAAKVEELKRPLDPTETAACRGMIEGLELALKIPEILEREGEENAKNGNAKGSESSGGGGSEV